MFQYSLQITLINGFQTQVCAPTETSTIVQHFARQTLHKIVRVVFVGAAKQCGEMQATKSPKDQQLDRAVNMFQFLCSQLGDAGKGNIAWH